MIMTKLFSSKFFPALIFLAIIIFIYFLAPVCLPFCISAFFAYLGVPLVKILERWHLPRSVAAFSVLFLIFFIFILLIVLLVPLLQQEFSILVDKMPGLINTFEYKMLPWINQQAVRFNVNLNFSGEKIQKLMSNHWGQTTTVLAYIWQTVSSSSKALINFFIDLFLIPLVTFYFLRDWNNILSVLENFLPPSMRHKTIQLIKECDDVLSAFFRGQLLIMLILGVIYSAGLAIIGLQVALLVGLIAGLLSIVPYLGFSVGFLMAILSSLTQFQDLKHLIYVSIVFIIGNSLEGMVLTPWIVGNKIGLHPIAVVFVILLGGHLFGFLGVLLALPVSCIAIVMGQHLTKHYKKSNLYQ